MTTAAAFGIDATVVRQLAGESDENWLVEADGRRLVLKVSPSGSDLDGLRLQVAVLDALAAGMPGWSFPSPVRTADGAAIVGDDRPARLLTFVDGVPWSEVVHPTPELQRELGALAAGCVRALADVDAPDGPPHDWDLRRLAPILAERAASLPERARADVERVVGWLPPSLDHLPAGLVHHDLNDNNVLVRRGPSGAFEIAGAIDAGDAMRTARVAEVAIAVAYAMLRTPEPLAVAARVVAGFHAELRLTEPELAVVFPLAAGRLCANAATWAHRLAAGEAGDYGRNRSQHTVPTLSLLATIDPAHAEAVLRAACGFAPLPDADGVRAWLADQPAVALIDGLERAEVVDLSTAAARWDLPEGERPTLGTAVPAIAPHGGIRHERAGRRTDDGPATLQLGVDVLCAAGLDVRVPLAGVVLAVDERGVIVVSHAGAPAPLWSVISGLDPASSPTAGDDVAAGAVVGRVAAGADGAPHVHWTLTTSRPRRDGAPPQLVPAVDRDLWLALAPDPTPLLAGAPVAPAPARRGAPEVVAAREERVARSQRSYYRRPPLLVRAQGTWFTDDLGRRYLDAMNNVAHVGHAHPKVLEAGIRQMRRLNTNSRFVYEPLADCADRLAGLLPPGLDVLFFTCTGSEANDLALRIARTVTGRDHAAVLGAAYHGNTISVTGISPDRFDGPGGAGPPATTRVLPQPDRYRGPYGYDHPDPGAAYAADAGRVIDEMVATGTPPAALFVESLQGTAGQVVLPDGYLPVVFDAVRAAGGLCVADEVQIGLGRLGSSYWGFEAHGVVPDIVTMGKPLGNGHPIAAVATTRAIADEFDNGMRYFNTFGGNPVSCAIALAVLDVVEEEGLQARAHVLGQRLLTGLRTLERHELVGDVRGHGLYAGVELVTDRATKAPAAEATSRVAERMMELGVLTYPNGRLGNILKLKPPMVSTEAEIDLLVEVIDEVLSS